MHTDTHKILWNCLHVYACISQCIARGPWYVRWILTDTTNLFGPTHSCENLSGVYISGQIIKFMLEMLYSYISLNCVNYMTFIIKKASNNICNAVKNFWPEQFGANSKCTSLWFLPNNTWLLFKVSLQNIWRAIDFCIECDINRFCINKFTLY